MVGAVYAQLIVAGVFLLVIVITMFWVQRPTREPVRAVPAGACAEAAIRSQAQFAQALGISLRTLQKWEQGEREPSGAAKSLIRIAQRHPKVLAEAMK